MVVLTLIFLSIAGFTIISGINDGGNLVATFLASGTIRPGWVLPLLLSSIGLGPVVFGTAVSHTIAVEVVNFAQAGPLVLLVALLAAVVTLLTTWWMKIPTSTTIALGGGMVGATLVSGRIHLIHWAGVAKLIAGLVGSVVLGFVVALVLTRLLWMGLKRLSMQQVQPLTRIQYLTAFWQGLAYGANDQEKAIGLMAVFWMLIDHHADYRVPWLAVAVPLVFWAAGLVVGGFRIARTVGNHVVRIEPMTALSTQWAAAVTVSLAALGGFPVSTTQTTDGALFGTGTALQPLAVRWVMVRKMVGVWVLTMPAAMVLGGLMMMGASALK
ncbi:MAG: inorganic phosphate transporter [Thermaerobacter sp.]|nr:inorganic phosphate transporter [Thermaerobacter sp.]